MGTVAEKSAVAWHGDGAARARAATGQGRAAPAQPANGSGASLDFPSAGGHGTVFLPLMSPLPLAPGVQHQFGLTLSLQAPTGAAQQQPRLPAIRTRGAAAAAAAAAPVAPQGSGVAGLGDLSDLFSPLAAHLQSPPALFNSPSGGRTPGAGLAT